MPVIPNAAVAARLEEVGRLLEQQGASSFRARAYRRAAESIRGRPDPLRAVYDAEGTKGLESVPGVGPAIARAIRDLLVTGTLPMLDRLRSEVDPARLLETVPGIGPGLAQRLHDALHVESLEDLEVAAHDGRLARVQGMGPKRLAGVRDSLAGRLARVRDRWPPHTPPPPVGELLDVDREYREQAAHGRLRKIAPRRFNPHREAWLPVLHTRRGGREYTALFSNTAGAHRLGATRDWVVLYPDGDGAASPHTVVTARKGPLEGLRVVRGRDSECERYYQRRRPSPSLPHAS